MSGSAAGTVGLLDALVSRLGLGEMRFALSYVQIWRSTYTPIKQVYCCFLECLSWWKSAAMLFYQGPKNVFLSGTKGYQEMLGIGNYPRFSWLNPGRWPC